MSDDNGGPAATGQAGTATEEIAAADARYAHLPMGLRSALEKYPFLVRSQHPVLVHFPMATAVLSPFFNLAYLLTGRRSLEETAFHLNIIGLASIPSAVSSGAFSWWVNYRAHWFSNIKVKVALTPLMLTGFAYLVITRARRPAIMDEPGGKRGTYLAVSFAMPAAAGIMGYFGGKIVHRH
jgi:uncharacterized membrane protein